MAVKTGKSVKIYTSEGKIDPHVYIVRGLQKEKVVLFCKETDQEIRVHKSRVLPPEEADSALETSTKITKKVSDALTIEKKPTPTKKAEEPAKVDFNSLIKDGFEVWTKPSLKFDHSGYAVEAHCVIDIDNLTYETFNTYNGSRGKDNGKPKKGKERKRNIFRLVDETALEKKRTLLGKKGYFKQTIQ